jgi:hypothetical protein
LDSDAAAEADDNDASSLTYAHLTLSFLFVSLETRPWQHARGRTLALKADTLTGLEG